LRIVKILHFNSGLIHLAKTNGSSKPLTYEHNYNPPQTCRDRRPRLSALNAKKQKAGAASRSPTEYGVTVHSAFTQPSGASKKEKVLANGKHFSPID
jgi:hypothetical protein